MHLFYLDSTHKFIYIFVVELHSKFQTIISLFVFICESWFSLF
jgi:hypothetical protein